jgi:hypothetical protein
VAEGDRDEGALDRHNDGLLRGLLTEDDATAQGGPRHMRASAQCCLCNGLQWRSGAAATTGAERGAARGAKSESDGVAAKRERLSPLGLALLLKVVEMGGGSKAAV